MRPDQSLGADPGVIATLRIAIAVAIATTFALSGLATAAEVQELQRSVSVSGEAERRVAPDMALLTMHVITEAMDPAEARREADATTQRALAILDAYGFKAGDVDSSGLSITPSYRWIKSESRQELTGYRVERSIEARLLDLEKLGRVLEELSNSGVNRMQPPRLRLQDEEALYQQVLAEAALNARQRAGIMANALGATLGPVQHISAQTYSRPQPMMAERQMLAVAADNSAGAVGESYQSGYLNYSVNVTASFVLE